MFFAGQECLQIRVLLDSVSPWSFSPCDCLISLGVVVKVVIMNGRTPGRWRVIVQMSEGLPKPVRKRYEKTVGGVHVSMY